MSAMFGAEQRIGRSHGKSRQAARAAPGVRVAWRRACAAKPNSASARRRKSLRRSWRTPSRRRGTRRKRPACRRPSPTIPVWLCPPSAARRAFVPPATPVIKPPTRKTNAKLLAALDGARDRSAYFFCALVFLAWANGSDAHHRDRALGWPDRGMSREAKTASGTTPTSSFRRWTGRRRNCRWAKKTPVHTAAKHAEAWRRNSRTCGEHAADGPLRASALVRAQVSILRL